MNKAIQEVMLVLSLGMLPFTTMAVDKDIMKKFNAMDNDGNGYISRSEATTDAQLRERWNNVDADKDGQLSTKEFKSFATVPEEPYPE